MSDRGAREAAGPASAAADALATMSGLIRDFDWGATRLGPSAAWPEALRSAVRLCLASHFPMQLWWGPDAVCLYNDATIPLLGQRHPQALGQAGAAASPDVWTLIAPQIEAARRRGETSYSERTHVVLTRKGFPEDAWFTWSFSPVTDESGTILGVHCVAIEETAHVLAEKSRERHSDERVAREADERARTILESIPEAFFALDREWRFTYLNPQCFVVLGRKPENLVGKSLWDEYPGLHGGPFEPVYRGVAATRVAASIVAYFPDHQRWYDVRAYPADGGGLSVYFRDVSLQKRAEEERDKLLESERAARAEAERAGRVKDEFLATLSHELRTPLNAILGWCSILNQGGAQSPADLAEGLETIERNARAQAQIIADILDMSSIIAGKVRVEIRRIELVDVISAAIDTVRPAVEGKGIQLVTNFPPATVLLSGDPNRLQQVFWNLLSNAAKFTPKAGRITVTLQVSEAQAQVTVTDTGNGIKPDFLPHVFDRFRQADSSTTRKFGGLGLGLSIVKQLVELHGGTVAVASPGVGKGATFVVTLPMAAARVPSGPAAETPEEEADEETIQRPHASDRLAGLRVLVVDDEVDARALVKRLLAEHGAIVTTAGSANEAFAWVATERFDVLVSDIGMPGEDGYSLIRRVRALVGPDQKGSIPALALTAYAQREDQARVLREGFQMYLPKPVEPAAIVAMVASLAGRTSGAP